MSKPFAEWDEHTQELAVEEVTLGLARGARAELFGRISAGDLEALEQSAAALNLAGLGQLETPPAALLRRLEADARAHFGPAAKPPATPFHAAEARRPRRWLLATTGWLAAAGLLAAFWLRSLPERAQDSATRRELLVASAPDLVRAEWVASADPLASGVRGDVVWSSARQEGYMRFRDIAPNDPQRNQYQLWIFDQTRDEWEARPVDGGVFDIGRGAEVVVPIDAKLEVRQAALFAVTLEPPGGVVVSRREHLLATATP